MMCPVVDKRLLGVVRMLLRVSRRAGCPARAGYGALARAKACRLYARVVGIDGRQQAHARGAGG